MGRISATGVVQFFWQRDVVSHNGFTLNRAKRNCGGAGPHHNTARLGLPINVSDCGLTADETAEVLHISPATVGREWTLAKAWLYAELQRSTE
jgi:ECF sigma factor